MINVGKGIQIFTNLDIRAAKRFVDLALGFDKFYLKDGKDLVAVSDNFYVLGGLKVEVGYNMDRYILSVHLGTREIYSDERIDVLEVVEHLEGREFYRLVEDIVMEYLAKNAESTWKKKE